MKKNEMLLLFYIYVTFIAAHLHFLYVRRIRTALGRRLFPHFDLNTQNSRFVTFIAQLFESNLDCMLKKTDDLS